MSEFLRSFDGVRSETVFCFWATGANMSQTRANALSTMVRAMGVNLVILTNETARSWEHPEAPFHPALELLCDTHKGDYLKSYLMHWYGGGYSDIKVTDKEWRPFFRLLKNSSDIGLGYQELGPRSVAEPSAHVRRILEERWRDLIGCCAFIFKRRTPFTTRLYTEAHTLLESKLNELRRSPASFPQDCLGETRPDGSVSTYPLRWYDMFGNIFHPLALQYSRYIGQVDLAPQFENYR